MKKVKEYVYEEAVLDLANLLIDYGFKPEDAVKVARDFWNKHKKQLENVF